MSHAFLFRKSQPFTVDLSTRIMQASNEALSSIPAGTTMLARANEAGDVEHFYVVPSESGANANRAFRLAQSLGARSEAVDAPDLSGSVLARLTWTRGSSVELETQSGTSLEPVAEALDANLLPGEWVAVGIRDAGALERPRWARWFGTQRPGQAATHHTLRRSARAVSVWSGASSLPRSQDLLEQFTASLGGFDLLATRAPVTKARALAFWLFVSIAGVLAWLLLDRLPQLIDALPRAVHEALPEASIVANALYPWAWTGAAAAAVAAVYWVAAMADLVPSNWSRIVGRLRAGTVPSPPVRVLRPSPPRAERSVAKAPDAQGVVRQRVIRARPGSYPLASSTFLMGSELAVAIMLPGRRATTTTASRPAPSSLLEPIGPQVGVTDAGAPVHLSLRDLWAGVMVFGAPGSGKTFLLAALLGQLFRWAAREAVGRVALVAFDTKGDSKFTRLLQRWAGWAGVKLRVLRLSDQDVPLAIDFFGKDCTPAQRRSRMIDAIKYLEQQGVGSRAEEVMLQVFPLAFLVDEAVTAQVPAVDAERSAFYYAWVLTGGLGEPVAEDLVAAIRDAASGPERDGALARAGDLFGGSMTANARHVKAESSRNKFATLAELEHLWSAAERPDVPGWEAILGGQESAAGVSTSRMVVFDFAGLSQSARDDAAAFIFYTFTEAVQRLAGGFQDASRSVIVTGDEIKSFANDNGDRINWVRSDGRSFGLVPIFATQEPVDLVDRVLEKVLGYATRISFAQSNKRIAERLAAELSYSSAQFTEDDVRGVEPRHAIVSTRVDGALQPTFTTRVPDFERELLDA